MEVVLEAQFSLRQMGRIRSTSIITAARGDDSFYTAARGSDSFYTAARGGDSLYTAARGGDSLYTAARGVVSWALIFTVVAW